MADKWPDDDGDSDQQDGDEDDDRRQSTHIFDMCQPTGPIHMKLPVPWRQYQYFKTWGLKQVKDAFPCKATKYSKDQQIATFNALQRFFDQDGCEEAGEGGSDDGYVVVTETYEPPKNNFPGRLASSDGSQGLVRAIRSNLLIYTSELAMTSDALPRCVLHACNTFDISFKLLQSYVSSNDTRRTESIDRQSKLIRKLMNENNCSVKRAEQLIATALTTTKKMRTSSATLKKFDAAAKKVQVKLMAQSDLRWIKEYCDSDNRVGSFVSHIHHLVEHKLLMYVRDAVERDFDVVAMGFDCLNLHNCLNLHDSVTHQLPAAAREACERIIPDINMLWEWRAADRMVETVDTLRPASDTDGRKLEIRVPDTYTPPRPPWALPTDGGGGGDNDDDDTVKLDPEIEPTYEELWSAFSLNMTYNGPFSLGIEGKVGKVSSDFIIKSDEDGSVSLYDEKHLRTRFRHLKYFEIVERKDFDGNMVKVKEEKAFIDKWLQDKRMTVGYMKNDKSNRYSWNRFDMYPNEADCPDSVYNLWYGFAVERMDLSNTFDNEGEKLLPDVRAGLLRLLEHFYMLCSRDSDQYKFMLNILAHAMQHPSTKIGIMLCLVGKQGCGKGHVWEIIERLVGRKACFTTSKPDKDVWGDNNGRMKDAFFVRITETDKKKFAGVIGEIRTIVSDDTIRVRDLYCTAHNVQSYTRFFLDTNFVDAIPDEHGERRFFIIKCNEEKIGNSDYFERLRNAIKDDPVIRAFYEFLRCREIKNMYLGKDIPIGAYQRDLKDSRRGSTEQFLEWFVQDQPFRTDLESGIGKVAPTVISLTADEIVKKYQSWQMNGREFERSKSSITRDLQLSSIPGITRSRPWEDVTLPVGIPDAMSGIYKVERKQITRYTLDLTQLRERYSLAVREEEGDNNTQPSSSSDITTSTTEVCHNDTPRADLKWFIKHNYDIDDMESSSSDDDEIDAIDEMMMTETEVAAVEEAGPSTPQQSSSSSLQPTTEGEYRKRKHPDNDDSEEQQRLREMQRLAEVKRLAEMQRLAEMDQKKEKLMRFQSGIPDDECDVLETLLSINPVITSEFVTKSGNVADLGPRAGISDARRVMRWLNLNQHDVSAVEKLTKMVYGN